MTMALICLESLTRIDSRLADDWRTKSTETAWSKAYRFRNTKELGMRFAG